ncbi:MAG: TonB-dependent receptor [Bacteroidales bacterium]|nr:TonB-dependent receptor [Bacteroidales bacterium]
MSKKVFLALAAFLCSVSLFAQGLPGGVTAKVVNRAGRVPVQGATVTLSQGGETVAQAVSDQDGKFLIEFLKNGTYQLAVNAEGFLPANVNVSVEGFVRDLIFISLVAENVVAEVDDSNFAEFDMEDSGYSDNPAILYGSNDPYNNIVGYGFSDIRFKNRGFNSENQDVLLAGIKLNDAITGYSPYSLWSGLNEAMRAKDTTIGLEAHDGSFGGYNGVTNILANPSSVRKGWRFSVLSNSALYRLRLMANYASGELDNGLSYAVNVSARLGGNDWVQGIYYKSLSYYLGVEKKFDDVHRLAFMTFAAPGERGAQNSSTQEVYDLMGDNMYNSNWGYQNGKLRNARVRTTFEPVFVLKYTATPTEKLTANAAILFRTGMNGYSALDWYDAADPRPDYYRNLPSYFWLDDEVLRQDMNRDNPFKYAAAKEAWTYNPNVQHIDWDHLYNVNYASEGGRAKYVQQERRTDQNDLNFAASAKWLTNSWFTLTGGVNARMNRTEFFQTVRDLLGGEYFVNIDNFAERDFAFSEAKVQNDLDYWMAHGSAEKIGKGGKYGYDYYAQVRNLGAWANTKFDLGMFKAFVAGQLGYTTFWREGLLRKGLFAGLDDNGREIVVDGIKLTSYDADGNVISSKGKSEAPKFLTGSVKTGAELDFTGGHRVYANVGYFQDAPKFNQAFLSPRTRNSLIPNLTTVKTAAADINYQLSNNGYEVRLTGFWAFIKDQTDMMSFYDDSHNSFSNMALSGINERHMGIELGFKVPMIVSGLNLQGALSAGEYVYTSTPTMTETIDNSAEVVVSDAPVTYWAAHPVYAKGADGKYIIDEFGNYQVEKVQKHYVPSTPQLAANLALNYRTSSYWFFTFGANYYAHSYLDMNPLYRTELAVVGPDDHLTNAVRKEHRMNWYMNETVINQGLSPDEISYMASQERFAPACVVNLSIGKSWYIQRKYNFGFSLEVKNMLNNRGIKTGGYEQTRLVSSQSYERYYRFDSKYFYMPGANYMLNLYYRF